MTDTIFITGVVIHARHGVMEHETEVGQRFVIDLELSADLAESSRTDRLADTVSYSNVRPARSPTPSWRRFPRSARSRSPFTSRTPRSPRSSTTSAWC